MTSAGAVGDSPGTPATIKLQILSTEHWSLLATRSLAWNEAFSRAGMFLSTLSGATVALALVAQASAFGSAFYVFAFVILPVTLFVGVTTFFRLSASNHHDATCVTGMNRIRGAYLELAPELEKYFVMSGHDDARGMALTMGVPQATSMVPHLLAGTPTLVLVLNSLLLGIIASLVALQLEAVTSVVLVAGLVGFVLLAMAHMAYGRQSIRRRQRGLTPLFPT